MFSSLVAITAVAAFGAALGVSLESMHKLARRMVPFSGGVLIGVALFWILPEMAEFFRWPGATAWTLAGFALLWFIDRFVYAVCPACSHTHEHDHCETRLHGFAAPLLVAAAVHSLMDGWTAGASGSVSGFGAAFLTGIAFHKLPEGLALGVIARASLRSRFGAIFWCAAAESATIAGGTFAIFLAPHFNANAIHAVLAVAGGSFLYLGGHAIHGELRRSGAAPAFVPALTGVAGSSVLRLLILRS